METPANRRAALNYRKRNVKQLSISLYPKDADIIEWLDNLQGEGKAEYIRRLIRDDMARN